MNPTVPSCEKYLRVEIEREGAITMKAYSSKPAGRAAKLGTSYEAGPKTPDARSVDCRKSGITHYRDLLIAKAFIFGRCSKMRLPLSDGAGRSGVVRE